MNVQKLKERMESVRAFDLPWDADDQKVAIRALTPTELDVMATRDVSPGSINEAVCTLAARITRGLDGATLFGESLDECTPDLARLWYEHNVAAASAVFTKAMERFKEQQDARKAEQKN